MLLRLFGVTAVLLTASYSSALTFRCSTAQSYSEQCPATAAGISERYRSASGVCGNGSAVTYSTSSNSCMGKRQLAALLNRQCEMSRQCGERLPIPAPVPLPKPLPVPLPKPNPEPIPMPKPIPDTLPPVQPPERPTFPNEPPPPAIPPSEPPHPVDLPPVALPKPLPTTLPPVIPVEPPPQTLPGTNLPPTSPPYFKGAYASAVAAGNLVTVTWSSSETVSNYCGTGTQYSRIAILDKNDSRNAVFFASYPTATRQYMSVTLVCAKPPAQSAPISLQNEMSGTASSLITVNYSEAGSLCYVSAFTAAASPPHCMIP